MKIPYSMLGIPDREVLNKELSEQIRIAVESLPEKQREIFILTVYEGKSYKQIFSLIGCNVNTAKALKREARENLKKILQPYLLGEF